MEFCKQFNARTQDKPGKICPVQITVYKDKSFDFLFKTSASSVNGSCKAKIGSVSLIVKVASVTWDKLELLLKTRW
jgi:large subunit ribosomal protein L11